MGFRANLLMTGSLACASVACATGPRPAEPPTTDSSWSATDLDEQSDTELSEAAPENGLPPVEVGRREVRSLGQTDLEATPYTPVTPPRVLPHGAPGTGAGGPPPTSASVNNNYYYRQGYALPGDPVYQRVAPHPVPHYTPTTPPSDTRRTSPSPAHDWAPPPSYGPAFPFRTAPADPWAPAR